MTEERIKILNINSTGFLWAEEETLLPANIVILFAVAVTKVKCIYCCKILLQLLLFKKKKLTLVYTPLGRSPMVEYQPS